MNKPLWTSVGLAIVVLLLSLLIKISNTPQDVLDSDPVGLFALQYDLVLIAFSILGGSFFTIDPTKPESKKLFLPMAVTFGILILCYAFANLSSVAWSYVVTYNDFVRVWIPMSLGLFSVGFAIYFVKS